MRSAGKFDRRTLLRGMAFAGMAPYVNMPAASAESGGFQLATDPPPANPLYAPKPSTPRPEGGGDCVFDNFGNHWCLGPPDGQANRQLFVLPAQAPERWFADHISALPVAPWQFVGADEFGFVWVASQTRCMRLDPHTPDAGWTDFTADIFAQAKPTKIGAMGVGPNGDIMLAFAAGGIVQVDRTDKTTVNRLDGPPGADSLLSDEAGRLWLRCGAKTYSRPPAPDAWQRQWELVDRLPASDHDLSGDLLGGRFYMAGGQNAGWGYPARPHVFRELYEFNPATRSWRVVAPLDQPRFYNGTSCLDGKVWVIGGCTRDAIGNPVLLSTVEIFDPSNGAMTPGPPLPTPIANPVALELNSRIYVAGAAKMDAAEHPCLLYSIGSGETAWRREPIGPAYKIATSGTAHDGHLYFALGGKGLGCFDAATRSWSLVAYPHSARSPQIAAYRDEVWVMGGRDIERQQRTVIYTPKTGQWKDGPDLPRPLAWGAAATVGGRLMVVGGAAGRGYSNRTFLMRPQRLT